MSVQIIKKGEIVTACLQGEIDHHTAADMRSKIDASVELYRPSLLILDFKGVTFMDSSGIGLVMGRYKAITDIGGELAITNTSVGIEKIMRLAGMEKLAKIGLEECSNESKK